MFQAEDLKAAVIKKSPAFKEFAVSQSTQDQYSPYLNIVFAMILSELHTHLPYSLFDSELTVNY
jgi:exonuclease V gamma subunit